MAFLSQPQNCIHAVESTPYLRHANTFDLSNVVYDRGPWLTFPERIGFVRDKKELSKQAGDSEERLSAKRVFLQTWLFFGILLDFLGVDVRQEAFVKDVSGTKVIAWTAILAHVRRWTRAVQAADRGSNARLKTRLDELSNAAGAYVVPYCDDVRGGESPLSLDLSLSILLLTRLLEYAKASVTSYLDRTHRIPSVTPLGLRTILKKQNWCPNAINRMRNNLDLLSTYYLSLLGPIQPNQVHDNCDDIVCKAFNLSDETYTQRHADNCTCRSPMSADEAATATMLSNGQFPLMLAQQPQFGRSRLEAVARERNLTPYVAISHVWSDGLGNPLQCALPRCQVERLQQWCDELSPAKAPGSSTYFWLDTLCIPRESGAKRRGIESMAKVYANADAVLVLDRSLQGISRNMSDLELSAHLYSCGWLRRVWTLQEGVKARKLWFRLNDGFLNLAAFTERVAARRLSEQELNIDDMVTEQFLQPLLNFAAIKEKPLSSLAAAMNEIQFRNTTKEYDVVRCVDGILGWAEHERPGPSSAQGGRRSAYAPPSAEPPRATSAATQNLDQLQSMLLRQPALPSEILFRTGRRMSQPGWRWAPAELNEQHPFILTGRSTARATTAGLRGTYYALYIEPTMAGELNQRFRLFDQTNSVWLAVLSLQAVDTGQLPIQDARERRSRDPQPSDWVDGLTGPTILCEYRLPRLHGSRACAGVLVNILHDAQGVKHAAFQCSVGLTALPDDFADETEGLKTANGEYSGLVKNRPTEFRLCRGGAWEEEWCIS